MLKTLSCTSYSTRTSLLLGYYSTTYHPLPDATSGPTRRLPRAVVVGQRRQHHFWIRSESKPFEARTIFLPIHVKKIIQNGHKVTVETSSQRCVPISEYKAVGAEIVEESSWTHNAPKDAIILGLKELPPSFPLIHRHIFFAHCYKGQKDARILLNRFKIGGGKLLDLEFLLDDQNRRIAAFGDSAGRVGMAIGITKWSDIQLNRKHPPPLKPFKSYTDLEAFVRQQCEGTTRKPTVLIVGCKGRVGSGSMKVAHNIGINPIGWDVEETKGKGGPFPEILDYDIFVNTINLVPNNDAFVFLNDELLTRAGSQRRLSLVVDISCDRSNKANPLPIYQQGSTTTFDNPVATVIEKPFLGLIAIDNLPTLVPEESSREFADLLLPYLLQFDSSNVWKKVLLTFEEHLKRVCD